ncbi:MAG TPA: hypothetical protein VN973_02305 [Candidatus Dormibacteraeota bacterium]|nr:hypothetical protein [Candidatus Dormibacteraeota bacterium]
MSKEVLEQVILKASSDLRFRAQLNDNFEAAIRPYDLNPEEKSELQKGMAGELADDRTARQTMAASASNTASTTASTTASNTASTTASASESTSATE